MSGKAGKKSWIVLVLIVTSFTAAAGRTPIPTAGPLPVPGVTTALPQQTSSPAAVPMVMGPPLADGGKNPASITDEVALRVLLLTTVLPANPSAKELGRFHAKVGRMNLEQSDLAKLTQALRRLHGLATPQRARVAATRQAEKHNPSAAAFARIAAEDGRLDTMAAETYRELLGSLSPDGVAKLREQVSYIKTKIKVLPPAKMSTSMPHH